MRCLFGCVHLAHLLSVKELLAQLEMMQHQIDDMSSVDGGTLFNVRVRAKISVRATCVIAFVHMALMVLRNR